MNLDDLELIINVKEKNCNESLKELISRHGAIYNCLYLRYKTSLDSVGFQKSQALQEMESVICDAIISYNKNKSPNKKIKFSTWLYTCSRYFFLNKINRFKDRSVYMEDENLLDLVDYSGYSDSVEVDNLSDYLSHLDDERVRKIFELRYNDGNTWREIGQVVGLSGQMVKNIHDKGAAILKEKIEIYG